MRLRSFSATALPSITVAVKAGRSLLGMSGIVQVPITLPQLRLLHLAHRIARHLAHENDALRQLELRQSLLQRRAQDTLLERGAGPRHDDGGDALAEVRMRHADDCAFRHAVQRVELGLDLDRVDIEAAADDEVLGAPDDEQVALSVQSTDVARDEEAILAELRRGL